MNTLIHTIKNTRATQHVKPPHSKSHNDFCTIKDLVINTSGRIFTLLPSAPQYISFAYPTKYDIHMLIIELEHCNIMFVNSEYYINILINSLHDGLTKIFDKYFMRHGVCIKKKTDFIQNNCFIFRDLTLQDETESIELLCAANDVCMKQNKRGIVFLLDGNISGKLRRMLMDGFYILASHSSNFIFKRFGANHSNIIITATGTKACENCTSTANCHGTHTDTIMDVFKSNIVKTLDRCTPDIHRIKMTCEPSNYLMSLYNIVSNYFALFDGGEYYENVVNICSLNKDFHIVGIDSSSIVVDDLIIDPNFKISCDKNVAIIVKALFKYICFYIKSAPTPNRYATFIKNLENLTPAQLMGVIYSIELIDVIKPLVRAHLLNKTDEVDIRLYLILIAISDKKIITQWNDTVKGGIFESFVRTSLTYTYRSNIFNSTLNYLFNILYDQSIKKNIAFVINSDNGNVVKIQVESFKYFDMCDGLLNAYIDEDSEQMEFDPRTDRYHIMLQPNIPRAHESVFIPAESMVEFDRKNLNRIGFIMMVNISIFELIRSLPKYEQIKGEVRQMLEIYTKFGDVKSTRVDAEVDILGGIMYYAMWRHPSVEIVVKNSSKFNLILKMIY